MAKQFKLNARQREFVRHFTAGADGVRGNATQAFIAAGYSPKGADAMGPRLLGNARVAAAIAEVHAAAESAATNKLRDWKDMAPAAQDRLERIAHGYLPATGTDGEIPIVTLGRDGAAVAKVILDANKELIERAYPKKLEVEHSGAGFVVWAGQRPKDAAEWAARFGGKAPRA